MPLSIIIPTLNEASALPRLLTQLRGQRGVELEIIIADGGSHDGTVAQAQAAGARVVAGARGRGRQMNAGAQAARGEWLLFLHADTELPSDSLLADALAALQNESARGNGRIAGHFPLRFARADSGHDFFFRYAEGKTRLNRPYTINGDQGLLLSARYFRELGGYDESLPFLEDQRLAAKIFAEGRWIVLPGHLVSSARRFESEGHAQRYTLMAIIMGLHAAGVEEFFTRAPKVYAAQDETGRLDLRPYLRLIRQILHERGRWRTLYRVGAFVRENTWQLFYYRDVKRNDGRWHCLEFCDRCFYPRVANPLGDFLAAFLVSAWFYLWLPLSLRLRT